MCAASTQTLNGALFTELFNIYGTHVITAATFGSVVTNCITTSTAAQSQMLSSSFNTASGVGYSGGGDSASGSFSLGSSSGSSSSSSSYNYNAAMILVPGNMNTGAIFPYGNLNINASAFQAQTQASITQSGQVVPIGVTAMALNDLITSAAAVAQILPVANAMAGAPPGGFTSQDLTQLSQAILGVMQFSYNQDGCQVAGGFQCFPV